MAVVPNLWGLWNMLWIATKSKTHLSIGVHGAFIPALLVPAGILLALRTTGWTATLGWLADSIRASTLPRGVRTVSALAPLTRVAWTTHSTLRSNRSWTN